MSSPSPVQPATSATQIPALQFEVYDGYVIFNQRKFAVKQGEVLITNQESLQKIVKIMNQQTDLEKIQKSISTDDEVVSSKNASPKIKIIISKENIDIEKKLEGGVSEKIEVLTDKIFGQQQLENQEAKKKILADRFTKLSGRISKHTALVNQLKSEFHSANYTKEAVINAINRILDEPPRKMDNVGTWQENTLAHCLQMYGNESLRSALIEVKNTYIDFPTQDNTQSKKCESRLRQFIMKHMIRPPKESELQGVENSGKVIQKFCKDVDVDAKGKISKIDNQALSSAEDKNLNPKESVNSNLGSVVITNPDGEKECIVTRSGRSNSSLRLRESVIHAALEQLGTEKQTGFTKQSDGVLEFTHHITSYLDPSTIKTLPTIPKKIKNYFTGSKKNVEDEKIYLKDILEARDSFKEEEITVQHGDQEIKIRLKKPILSNELFSSTVRGVHVFNTRIASMGWDTRDRIDFVSNMELFCRAYPIPQDDGLIESSKNLVEKFPEVFSLSQDTGIIDPAEISQKELVYSSTQISKAFSSPEMKEYKEALAIFYLGQYTDSQTDDERNKARALFALTFRKDIADYAELDIENAAGILSNPPSLTEELHAADLEIFRNFIDKSLNISSGKQCKSGTDRTGVGIALAVAQNEFKNIYDKDFLPAELIEKTSINEKNQAQEERVAFKLFFRKALVDLGLSMTVETKGYSGLKLIDGLRIFGGVGNPVPLKYLLNKDDLEVIQNNPFLREICEKNFNGVPQIDVTLDENAFQERGLRQYQGHFSDSYMYGSKSSGVKQNDVVSPELKSTALERAYTKLKEFFIHDIVPWAWSSGIKESDADDEKSGKRLLKARKLFDANLNLIPHINQLGFSRVNSVRQEQRRRIHDAIKELEEELKKSPLEQTLKMEIYIFKQVLWLDEQREKSKELVLNKFSSKMNGSTTDRSQDIEPTSNTSITLEEVPL